MDPTASTSSTAHTAHDQESSLHESSNIALRPIIKFTIWFVIGLVIVHVIILSIFFAFRSAAAQERQITGVDAPRIPPPQPRLEPSIDHNRLPADDLRDLRARETEELKARKLLDADGKPMWTDHPDDLIRRINAWSK
jgi:hypothetical protein